MTIDSWLIIGLHREALAIETDGRRDENTRRQACSARLLIQSPRERARGLRRAAWVSEVARGTTLGVSLAVPGDELAAGVRFGVAGVE